MRVDSKLMATIGVLADRETATYFKITGIRNSFAVNNREEAEERLTKLLQAQDISLIFVTEEINEWLRPIIGRVRRGREYPLIVSILGKRGKKPRADQLAELVKRTVGVEIKIGQGFTK
nr:V-type ATP synthase subunit F [Candidatus Njordarchaeum guaymaensis]